MTRLLRTCFALATTLAFLSAAASADLKIKTRTTVMGHSTESTVYIKGGRERTRDELRRPRWRGHHYAVRSEAHDHHQRRPLHGHVDGWGRNLLSANFPSLRNHGTGNREGAEAPARKGGVITVSRSSTDTGERQEMFGYKARHIKTSMVMESSPDACNQSHMKMETDGWYADLSAAFSCGDESYRSLACGGMGRRGGGCTDRIVVKGGGGGALGYPLKQTTTMVTEQGTFTTTTEVLEIANATLDAPLFEVPPGCRSMDASAMTGGAPAAAEPSCRARA